MVLILGGAIAVDDSDSWGPLKSCCCEVVAELLVVGMLVLSGFGIWLIGFSGDGF